MLIIKRRPIVIRLLREVFYRTITPPKKLYYKIRKPITSGSRVVIRNDKGEYLLAKAGYGTKSWTWPGGAIDAGETPEQAAMRETEEETGVVLHGVTLGGSRYYEWEGKRDTVYYFYAHSNAENFVIDDQEITNVAWFSTDNFPKPLAGVVSDGLEEVASLIQQSEG